MERRYIACVVGVRPGIIETSTDYLVAVPRYRKAFLITMNPMAEAVVGRGTALAVFRKARERVVPVFGDGRCIVYVFHALLAPCVRADCACFSLCWNIITCTRLTGTITR